MDGPKLDRQGKVAFTFTLLLIIGFAILLFSLPVRAAALVLVCDYKTHTCDVATARIVLTVPTETQLPTQCLADAAQKVAQAAHLIGPGETVRITCPR